MEKAILTKKELKAQIKEHDGIVSGVVPVSLYEITLNDFETFLDILSKRLTGNTFLVGTTYKLIGCNTFTQEILLQVTGDASACLEG